MAVTEEQIAFVTDLFIDLGPISTRKMFGGLGLYSGGAIFAIMFADGRLLLKGAGSMPATYEAHGWAPWVYTRKDGATASMPYWEMPDALLDDPDAACDWARRAIAEL